MEPMTSGSGGSEAEAFDETLPRRQIGGLLFGVIQLMILSIAGRVESAAFRRPSGFVGSDRNDIACFHRLVGLVFVNIYFFRNRKTYRG